MKRVCRYKKRPALNNLNLTSIRILQCIAEHLNTYFDEVEIVKYKERMSNLLKKHVPAWKMKSKHEGIRDVPHMKSLRSPTQNIVLHEVKQIIKSSRPREQEDNENEIFPYEPHSLKKNLLYLLKFDDSCKLEGTDLKRMKNAIYHLTEMLKSDRDPKIEYGENDGSGVTSYKVDQAVQALLKLMEGDDTTLLGNEGKDIYLYIKSFKLPITSGEIRIYLPHSLLPDSPDVCLFSADLQKGKRIDHEPTLEYVKNILSKNGVTEISEVITLRQLKTEYDQYELKRALCNRFDLFLSDAKVCGHIVHLLGKIFYSRKKIPVPIQLDSKNLKKSIETALHKTTLHLHKVGKLFNLKVANTRMTPEQIRENIIAATTALHDRFPGGWNNVLMLMIQGVRTTPVPFYLSTMNDNDVEVKPPKRPKNAVTVHGSLDGFVNVSVHPCGDVTFKSSEKRNRKSRSNRKFKMFNTYNNEEMDSSAGKTEDDGDIKQFEYESNYDDVSHNKSDIADKNISGEDEIAAPKTVSSDDSEGENNSLSTKSGVFSIESTYLQKLEKMRALKQTSRKRSIKDI